MRTWLKTKRQVRERLERKKKTDYFSVCSMLSYAEYVIRKRRRDTCLLWECRFQAFFDQKRIFPRQPVLGQNVETCVGSLINTPRQNQRDRFINSSYRSFAYFSIWDVCIQRSVHMYLALHMLLHVQNDTNKIRN